MSENYAANSVNENVLVGSIALLAILFIVGIYIRYINSDEPEEPWTSGPRGCFSPNALVRLANGSEKTIQKIVVGDQVLGVNAWGRRVSNYVTRVFVHDGSHETLLINGSLQATPNHPIAVKYFVFWKKWVEAGSLKVGDLLIGVKGNVRVNSIAPSGTLATVYNLEVETSHTYFANNLLVHNKKP